MLLGILLAITDGVILGILLGSALSDGMGLIIVGLDEGAFDIVGLRETLGTADGASQLGKFTSMKKV